MKFSFPVDASLVKIALECPGEPLFLAHGSISGQMPYYAGDDWDQIRADMRRLYAIAHGGISEIIAQTGMTQTSFAKRFGIPLRSIQNWCGGQSKAPDYLIGMVMEILFN